MERSVKSLVTKNGLIVKCKLIMGLGFICEGAPFTKFCYFSFTLFYCLIYSWLSCKVLDVIALPIESLFALE